MRPSDRDLYARALDAVSRASGASDRFRVIRETAELLGVSVPTVYRQLHALGWSSGRKVRTDRGTSLVGEAQAVRVAEILAKGRNKRGQPNVPMREAHAIAQENGLLGDVSCSTLVRALNRQGLGLRAMRAPEASVARVSRCPNHVWLVDVSVAVQWYFRDERGRAMDLYYDAGARFYEGKPQNTPVRKILRYVVTDHYSGCYYVRYYYAEGESAESMVDFLFRAMSTKEGVGRAFPFRGIPRRMVADQGPANKSALVRTLLGTDGLDVKLELHRTGNAKASGSVETRHNHWQRSFEGRLGQDPAPNLDVLNERAIQLCALMTAERDHTRHGKPPLALWCTILPEQLVEAPDRRVFLQLAQGAPRTATVDNYLRIRADGKVWELRGDLVHPTMKVRFRIAPYAETGIRVWNDQGDELAAVPLTFDAAGFTENGRRHVWDDPAEKGATAPLTPAQRISAGVAAGTITPEPIAVFDDLEARIARQTYLSPSGSTWSPREGVAAEPLASDIELREEVFRLLGRPLTRDEGDWWRDQIGGGLTRSAFGAAWTLFLNRAASAAHAGGIG